MLSKWKCNKPTTTTGVVLFTNCLKTYVVFSKFEWTFMIICLYIRNVYPDFAKYSPTPNACKSWLKECWAQIRFTTCTNSRHSQKPEYWLSGACMAVAISHCFFNVTIHCFFINIQIILPKENVVILLTSSKTRMFL